MTEAHRAAAGGESGQRASRSRQETFFDALHATLDAVGRTQEMIARRAGVGASTMSCYSTGRRVPVLENLEKIYKVLEAEGVDQGIKLPHSLSDLLDLRLEAELEKRFPEAAAKVPHRMESAIPSAVEAALVEPAVAPVPLTRGTGATVSLDTPPTSLITHAILRLAGFATLTPTPGSWVAACLRATSRSPLPPTGRLGRKRRWRPCSTRPPTVTCRRPSTSPPPCWKKAI